LVKRPVRWITFGIQSTEYLTSNGVPLNRILQLQNGVDDALFLPYGEVESTALPRPLVLVVGRLVQLKGLDAMLESIGRLQAQGYEFSVRLVGDGPRRELLESTVARLGLRNIEFAGGLPLERLPVQYRTADVLLFPTLQDVWGMVANEALLCGTPVVCSKYAGCSSDIIPPENVFDPLDPDDFDRALLRAITGKAGPADRSPIWSMKRIVDELCAHLESVLGSSETR
jgi:glycosyltransferase involved in cell wall biosynthesis